MQIAVGQPIPSFTAASTQGEISLESLKGQKTVLYFYPKDNTPGCTTQAQGFRDHHEEFTAAGARIIGVSRDSLKSHENFSAKQALPFALISDPDETLCELFGVMKMKNMYGKQVRGIERSTFLINADGTLLREWRGLRVPGHVDAVLQAVRES
ncbi:peroxiredoxin [Achromobacter sp. F4_2707]|uniref:peroxiredoxin n=1 Tax=Achromobacter sp. F4_2707 TaxID=3114286 RepID=UPI0039C74651